MFVGWMHKPEIVPPCWRTARSATRNFHGLDLQKHCCHEPQRQRQAACGVRHAAKRQRQRNGSGSGSSSSSSSSSCNNSSVYMYAMCSTHCMCSHAQREHACIYVYMYGHRHAVSKRIRQVKRSDNLLTQQPNCSQTKFSARATQLLASLVLRASNDLSNFRIRRPCCRASTRWPRQQTCMLL